MKLRFRFEPELLFFLFILFSCQGLDKKSNNKLIYWSSNNQDEIKFAQEVVNNWNQHSQNRSIHTQPVPEHTGTHAGDRCIETVHQRAFLAFGANRS